MASWRKLLARMVADPDPRSYSYDEAAKVLGHLDFELKKSKGSHRKWRREIDGPEGKRGIIVGLVDEGHGTVKPEYIKEMIDTLREHNLLPAED